MTRISFSQLRAGLAIIVLSSFLISCSTQATARFWGQTKAPKEQVLRYISGSEPESLDPQVPTGQPEARVLMAFYDGLVEYHPKTMDPIPAIAESWEPSADGTEYTFHLRKNAKFSNGDPITAKDFVYTMRRALSPELAAQNAYLAYYIKYAEAYNSGKSFVKRPDGTFILEKDVASDTATAAPVAEKSATRTVEPGVPVADPLTTEKIANPQVAETEFHKYINEPERLTVPDDEKSQKTLFEKNPKIKAAVEKGQLVPIEGKDIGVEAVDDYTFRMKLIQPAPFFIGLLGHQFFRVVHQGTVEKFGKDWTKPENIVTSGAFNLAAHKPYDEIVAVKSPTYWDAENVRLQRIEFYPLEEQTTMMNLYKAGTVDATYNHTVPAGWKSVVKQYEEEYLNFPEVSIEYYTISVNKPPMDNVKIRRAFSQAVNREALATFRRNALNPLIDFTPEGAFPKYEQVRDRVYAELLKKDGITTEERKSQIFNPKRACDLFEEAGYKVRERKPDGRCTIETNPAAQGAFPATDVEILYNTSESNKAVAEFIQAQWKQNLGVTVPLKNQEWKTFLKVRKDVEYKGFGRSGWVGDYIDPFTFLNLFYGKNNDSSTGWHNPEYDKMLDDANKELDPEKRFEKLAQAEYFLMKDQPVIPFLTQETNWIKKPYVKGLYPNPGTLHPWKFVYIEQDPAKWDTQVKNIMKADEPWVEQQISRLMKTQEDFQKSKQAGTKETNTAKAE
ncbi:MAG TPA: peptide ABC transporter substrate-binding protein [Pyrinomonadaceae bacterium]|jgi:oligopeptide transport system substrate-binding protein